MGWICYIIAILLYFGEPTSGTWMAVFLIGMLFHFKYWFFGIIAFFIGAGWKKPF